MGDSSSGKPSRTIISASAAKPALGDKPSNIHAGLKKEKEDIAPKATPRRSEGAQQTSGRKPIASPKLGNHITRTGLEAQQDAAEYQIK